MERSRAFRWNTPLFLQLDPGMRRDISQLVQLSAEIAEKLPEVDQQQLDRLRSLDQSLRTASFALAKEEQEIDLPRHRSPKINQLNYLFTGWQRGLLERGPVELFAREYDSEVKRTCKELDKAAARPNPRETDQEREVIENAQDQLLRYADLVQRFRQLIAGGPSACAPLMAEILQVGSTLDAAFQALENCSPVEEPCPFCGGQISFSGRCRKCTRRLPHLETVEGAEQEPESTFISNNCREVDLALLRWERDTGNLELWQDFQRAVRAFAGKVTQAHKNFEMLSMAADRPIDSQSDLRQKEVALKEVGEAFQAALSTLGKFAESSSPPDHFLGDEWREPLRQAEDRLREMQTALEPQAEENA